MKVLLTGSAGFIGYHVAVALLERGDEVIGLENFNQYYEPKLKDSRQEKLAAYATCILPNRASPCIWFVRMAAQPTF